MSTDPQVDAWFAQTDHPLKQVMLRVRELVLGVEWIELKSPRQ
jgi:hypothetical protein